MVAENTNFARFPLLHYLCYSKVMGLFDDIFSKATEITGMGQDAADAATQAQEEVSAQAEEHLQNATEQLPENPQDAVDQILGGWDQGK